MTKSLAISHPVDAGGRTMTDRHVEIRDNRVARGPGPIHRFTVHGFMGDREVGRTYYADTIFDAVHHAEERIPALRDWSL